MRPEHDVAGNSPRLADQHLWSAEDEMASEVEIGDFLYGLVRALKPAKVVETGTYHGATFKRMHEAIRANGIGEITGCDSALFISQIGGNWAILAGKSEEIKSEIEQCDLLFSDSSTEARKEEVSWLKPGAIAVVHDTYVYPELGEFVKSQGGILFDTPRGFGMIRK